MNLNKDGGGEAVVRLKHRLGREVEALRFPVRILEDQVPVVRWLSPMAKELKVRPDEVLSLRYEVTEDFGLAAAQLEVKASGKEPTRTNLDLPEKMAGGAKPARFRAQRAAIGALTEKWPGVGELRLRVRAEDARPAELDGPGVDTASGFCCASTAMPNRSHARRCAPSTMAARDDREGFHQINEAKGPMDWHRGEMKNEELSKDAKKNFAEAREKLADAQEKLEKLAEQMQDSGACPKGGRGEEGCGAGGRRAPGIRERSSSGWPAAPRGEARQRQAIVRTRR